MSAAAAGQPPDGSGEELDSFPDSDAGAGLPAPGPPLPTDVARQVREAHNRAGGPAPGDPGDPEPVVPAPAPARPRPRHAPPAGPEAGAPPPGSAAEPAGARPSAVFGSPTSVDAPPELADLDRPPEPAARAAAAEPPSGRATLARRALASLVDGAAALAVVAFVALVAEVVRIRTAGGVTVPPVALAAAWVAVGWGAVLIGDGLFGATLGRRACGVRLVRPDGAPAGWWRPLVRRAAVDLRAALVLGLAFALTLRRQGASAGPLLPPSAADAGVFAAFAAILAAMLLLLGRAGPRRAALADAVSGTVSAVAPPPEAARPAVSVSRVIRAAPRRRVRERRRAPVVPDYLRLPGDPDDEADERPPRPRVLRARTGRAEDPRLDHPEGFDAPHGLPGRAAAYLVRRLGSRSRWQGGFDAPRGLPGRVAAYLVRCLGSRSR